MSYKGLDEIEPGTTDWGATEKQIKRDLVDAIVEDCLTQEIEATGHKHNKVYNGYGEVAVESPENSNVLNIGYSDEYGNSSVGNLDISMTSSGILRIYTSGVAEPLITINSGTNTIDIGNGTSTVNVNGAEIS